MHFYDMNKIAISALVLTIAVITGAFGAHMLRNLLTEEHLRSWQTAVQYMFFHGLGMLIIAIIPQSIISRPKMLDLSWKFLLTGVCLFSGSIFFLSTTEITQLNMKWLGPVTPIGGMFFIAGWMMLAFSSMKKKKS